MDQPVHWNLLGKYLAGQCTPHEEDRVHAWLEEEPERKRLLDELERIWDMTDRSSSERDVDALWTRLQRHVRRTEAQDAPVMGQELEEANGQAHPHRQAADRPADRRAADRATLHQRRRSAAQRLARVATMAVVVLVVALGGIWLWGGDPSGRSVDEQQVFATERGQRATVRLPDGTQVRLNAASTITLAPSFRTEARSVQLEGEAYFDVADDTTRPFIVRAGPAAAQVLGTRFSMSAYPESEEVRVVVTEGKVNFGADDEGRDASTAHGDAGASEPDTAASEDVTLRKVVLAARQMGRLTRAGQVTRSQADLDRALAWMDGMLYLDNASFREVARTLERWYDVNVVVNGEATPAGHLNAQFDDRQPLGEVLQVIGTTFKLSYEWEGKTVRFTMPGSGAVDR